MSPALSIFCYLVVGTVLLSSGIFLAVSWALKRKDELRRRLEITVACYRKAYDEERSRASDAELALAEARALIVSLKARAFLDRQPSPN